MTAQLDLIDYIATPQNWRHSDPVTSKAAGLSTPDFRSQHHAAILDCLRSQGRALACEEIAHHTALDYVQVGKRTNELLRDGSIERTAEQHTNRSGRKAFRYRIKSQLCRAASSSGSTLE